jgi:hypothetical protein
VLALALDAALGQRHGLGGGGGFVQHGRVGHGHARQVADHGLEVDQRFHAALRDLGLVGRVGGVPGGVLQDVAQDDARRVRAVVALADEALEHLVLLAMAFSSASAAASVTGAGRSMAALRAMLRGTMLSISARREASPMTDSMCASSAAHADVAGE